MLLFLSIWYLNNHNYYSIQIMTWCHCPISQGLIPKKTVFNQQSNPFVTQHSISTSPSTLSSLHTKVIRNFPEEDIDYDGRLTDSFFKYVIRDKDYDRNEVPWIGQRGSTPVIIRVSAFLRKVFDRYKKITLYYKNQIW